MLVVRLAVVLTFASCACLVFADRQMVYSVRDLSSLVRNGSVHSDRECMFALAALVVVVQLVDGNDLLNYDTPTTLPK